jgi:DNA (cytosine-5)-methyltransferase 3A
MNVLSLFDGMSCGQIALKEHGFIVDKYYASEIDKFAIKQTQLNFPNTIQLGSVTEWRTWDIDWSSINLICAGSPCQGFSFAGKQLAFDDPRSKLFFVFVEILNHCRKFNPEVKFLLENVDMKKDHLKIISEYVGIFPTKINSALASAQNRERWYWTNIKTKQVGLFDELYTDIPQPEDKGIFLRDILQPENEVDKKYWLDGSMLEWWNKNKDFQLEKKYSQLDGDKAICLTARSYASWNGNYITHNLQQRNGKGQGGKGHLQKTDQKSYCLDTAYAQAIEFTKNYVQWDVSGKGYKSQQDRAFYEDTKHGTLSSSRSENKTGVFFENGTLRKLTPIECARLQTIPDWYKWECSDSQIYRMLGNGWTVDIIKHIFSYMESDNKLSKS